MDSSYMKCLVSRAYRQNNTQAVVMIWVDTPGAGKFCSEKPQWLYPGLFQSRLP